MRVWAESHYGHWGGKRRVLMGAITSTAAAVAGQIEGQQSEVSLSRQVHAKGFLLRGALRQQPWCCALQGVVLAEAAVPEAEIRWSTLLMSGGDWSRQDGGVGTQQPSRRHGQGWRRRAVDEC